MDDIDRVEIEYGHGIRFVAALWIITLQYKHVLDSERGCANEIGCNRDAIPVAAGHLQHGIESVLQQQR